MPALRLQLRALVVLAVTRVLLTRRGTTATLRVLTRRHPNRAGHVSAREALRAVRQAGRLLGGKCLVQSVALAAVLEQANQHPTLVLGCHQHADRHWTAHAWVVLGDDVLEPVIGGPHAELARLDASTDWVPSAPDAEVREERC